MSAMSGSIATIDLPYPAKPCTSFVMHSAFGGFSVTRAFHCIQSGWMR